MTRNRDAEVARRNRRELIAAKLGRRDLMKLGLLTASGLLVAKRGLSARVAGATSSPPTTPFIAPLPIPRVLEPQASMTPAPPSESDGFPADFFDSGFFYDQHYPNVCAGFDASPPAGDVRETMNTLWYHDHRFDFTAQNVYKGLAGFYLLFDEVDSGDETDPNPRALRLPSGEFDVPLMFADKVFDADGQVFFDFFNFDGILGDKFIVNAAIERDAAAALRRRPEPFRARSQPGSADAACAPDDRHARGGGDADVAIRAEERGVGDQREVLQCERGPRHAEARDGRGLGPAEQLGRLPAPDPHPLRRAPDPLRERRRPAARGVAADGRRPPAGERGGPDLPALPGFSRTVPHALPQRRPRGPRDDAALGHRAMNRRTFLSAGADSLIGCAALRRGPGSPPAVAPR